MLLFDQALKFYIKLSMTIGQEHQIADWFIIHFTENNGMAFGLEFAGEWGKLALSVFRILAVAGIFIYLIFITRKKSTLWTCFWHLYDFGRRSGKHHR